MDILEFPSGLTGLLGLKQQGHTPSDISSTISGIVQMEQMYALSRWESFLATIAAPVVGTNDLLDFSTGLIEVIPPGETWYCHGYRGQIATAAATAIKFELGIRPKATTGGPLYFGQPYSAGASETAFATADSIRGMLLPPGTSFCIGVNTITGVPGALFAALYFSRFRL